MLSSIDINVRGVSAAYEITDAFGNNPAGALPQKPPLPQKPLMLPQN